MVDNYRVIGARHSPGSKFAPGHTTESVRLVNGNGYVIKQYPLTQEGTANNAAALEYLALSRLCGGCVTKETSWKSIKIKEPLVPGVPLTFFRERGGLPELIKKLVKGLLVKQMKFFGIAPGDFQDSSVVISFYQEDDKRVTGLSSNEENAYKIKVQGPEGTNIILQAARIDFGEDFILPSGKKFKNALQQLYEKAREYKQQNEREAWKDNFKVALEELNKGLDGFKLSLDESSLRVELSFPEMVTEVPFARTHNLLVTELNRLLYSSQRRKLNPYTLAIAFSLVVSKEAINSIDNSFWRSKDPNSFATLFPYLKELGFDVQTDYWRKSVGTLRSSIKQHIETLTQGQVPGNIVDFITNINSELAKIFDEAVRIPNAARPQRDVGGLNEIVDIVAENAKNPHTRGVFMSKERVLKALGIDLPPSDDDWEEMRFLSHLRINPDKDYPNDLKLLVEKFILWHDELSRQNPELFHKVESNITGGLFRPPRYKGTAGSDRDRFILTRWSNISVLAIHKLFKNNLDSIFRPTSVMHFRADALKKTVVGILNDPNLSEYERTSLIVSALMPLFYYDSLLQEDDKRKSSVAQVKEMIKNLSPDRWEGIVRDIKTNIVTFNKLMNKST